MVEAVRFDVWGLAGRRRKEVAKSKAFREIIHCANALAMGH